MQQAWAPLNPVARGIDSYVAPLSGTVTPDMVLGGLFSGESSLTISEPEAITLAELWIESMEACVVPILVGNGEFIRRDETRVSFTQMSAFFAQHSEWMRKATLWGLPDRACWVTYS